MLETIVTVLAGALLAVVLAGGLFTVLVGLGNAITESVQAQPPRSGHSGRIALHH